LKEYKNKRILSILFAKLLLGKKGKAYSGWNYP